MAATEKEKRAQVERALGRELSPGESKAVPDVDALCPAHLEALGAIRASDIVAAFFYVSLVVPSCPLDVVNRLVRDYEPVPKDLSSSPLKLEKLYETTLGRALVPGERALVSSFASLGPEQLEVARRLSAKDVLIGLTYLGEVVPSAPGMEREAFATALAEGRT